MHVFGVGPKEDHLDEVISLSPLLCVLSSLSTFLLLHVVFPVLQWKVGKLITEK